MRSKKFEFTDEQIKYIIENWGIESVHSMKKKFGCTWYAIAQIAEKNGLELPVSNNWTLEEIEMLKTLSDMYHYEDIAIKMNKTENAIYLKAKKLGITLIQDKRSWTTEEEEYLYERWGRDAIEKIAKEMKRSVFSIKVKATRMNLGYMSQANIDKVSVADISRILNVRAERITDTWIKLGLKLRKKKVTKNYGYYCISIDDLLLFLKEHQDLWNSQNLEENILGKEPDWLIQKRNQDLINPPYEYQIWTDEEINLAKDLLLQGYDYEQISKKVNHTPIGVAYKLREVGLSYKLPQFWKGHEFKYLQENYMNMTHSEMAEQLGRSTKAISAKAEEFGYQKKKVLKKEYKKNE